MFSPAFAEYYSEAVIDRVRRDMDRERALRRAAPVAIVAPSLGNRVRAAYHGFVTGRAALSR